MRIWLSLLYSSKTILLHSMVHIVYETALFVCIYTKPLFKHNLSISSRSLTLYIYIYTLLSFPVYCHNLNIVYSILQNIFTCWYIIDEKIADIFMKKIPGFPCLKWHEMPKYVCVFFFLFILFALFFCKGLLCSPNCECYFCLFFFSPSFGHNTVSLWKKKKQKGI